ncbi:MAG: hypothetical protein ACKO7W_20435 [Elainella sp.]
MNYTISRTSTQIEQEQIRQEQKRRIHAVLQTAVGLPLPTCRDYIRTELLALKAFCRRWGRLFIVIEEQITCAQHDLGGKEEQAATLFRGPDQNASVAICITAQGSLAYRNGTLWCIHRNGGDIGSVICSARPDH